MLVRNYSDRRLINEYSDMVDHLKVIGHVGFLFCIYSRTLHASCRVTSKSNAAFRVTIASHFVGCGRWGCQILAI